MRYLLTTLTRDLRVDALPGAPLTRRSPMGVFVPLKSPSKVPSHVLRRFSSASRLAAGPSKNCLLPSALEVDWTIEGRERELIHRLFCRPRLLYLWSHTATAMLSSWLKRLFIRSAGLLDPWSQIHEVALVSWWYCPICYQCSRCWVARNFSERRKLRRYPASRARWEGLDPTPPSSKGFDRNLLS